MRNFHCASSSSCSKSISCCTFHWRPQLLDESAKTNVKRETIIRTTKNQLITAHHPRRCERSSNAFSKRHLAEKFSLNIQEPIINGVSFLFTLKARDTCDRAFIYVAQRSGQGEGIETRRAPSTVKLNARRTLKILGSRRNGMRAGAAASRTPS